MPTPTKLATIMPTSESRMMLGMTLVLGFVCSQRSRRGLLHVIVELSLRVHVRVRAGACHVAADKNVPVHLSNLFDLREITGDVLGQCKAAPWQPTGKHHVNDHKHSLRW